MAVQECRHGLGEHWLTGVRGIRNAWVRGSIPRGGSTLKASISGACSSVQVFHNLPSLARRLAVMPRFRPFSKRATLPTLRGRLRRSDCARMMTLLVGVVRERIRTGAAALGGLSSPKEGKRGEHSPMTSVRLATSRHERD